MSSVVIGTPCYGGLASVPYMESVLTAANRRDAPYTIALTTITNESLITRARNTIVSDFLDSDADRLVFVDADIRFSVNDFDAIVVTDRDVVGGIVPVKTVDFENAAAVEEPNAASLRVAATRYAVTPEQPEYREGSLVRVRHLGSAFLSISRDAAQAVADANPQLQYEHEGRKRFALFETMIRDGRYLSEDYAFCERWRDLGGEVWADYSVRLSHFGNYEFRG